MGVVYSLSLTPADVGNRVVIRYRLPTGQPTDALGELVSWAGDVLAVRRADGTVVHVARTDVLAAKVVPPAPTRRGHRVSADTLAELAARTWGATESEWLGRWWLRAAEGFTRRANSAVPLGDPGLPFEEALVRVRDWYLERSLPVVIQTVAGSQLDDALGARGWAATGPADVHVAAVAYSLGALGDGPLADVQLGGAPSDEWLSHYRAGRVPPVARRVLTGGPEVAFAQVPHTAIGRAAVADGWVAISAVEVDPAARRSGHARTIMRTLLQVAQDAGADRAMLAVEEGNAAALALYRSLGFTVHHRYHYRTAP